MVGAPGRYEKGGRGTMIEGEFLVADDLGPLGRLVAPGELRVWEPREVHEFYRERDWISERYLEADKKAEAARRRLKTAHLGGRRDEMREAFEVWTIEAAKYALIDKYLAAVVGQLEGGRQQAMNPERTFDWNSIPQVTDVIQRVIKARDDEIIGGVVFRAR